MLDIQYIRDHSDEVQKNCERRRVLVDITTVLALDTERRSLLQHLEDLRAIKNKTSKGKPSDEDIYKMKKLGEDVKELENKLASIEHAIAPLLLIIPNMTHTDVPDGGEDDFKTLEEHGKKPTFKFEPKDHETILTDLDMIDFERGGRVASSKFYFAKDDLVKLNMALIQYGMRMAEEYGFTLMETPDLAREAIAIGAGFNPRGDEDQIYSITNTDLSLVGTAEITTLGYHAGETLDLSGGPKKYASISHCFRKEAGTYGRTSKGLYRVHQFTKLELFVFCKPEDSEFLHEEMRTIEKKICDGLGLHYRVIDVAAGDLGGPAYRKYDIEAWMQMKGTGHEGGYGEITSTSNCLDYQARRLNIRYKNGDSRSLVHTLNGTAIVTSRFPIAIVEQFQHKEGWVKIPKVLHDLMGQKTLG